MRAPATRLLPVLLMGAMLTLAACGGPSGRGGPSTLPTAANPVTLTGGSTTLALDPQTAGVLEDNQVTISAVAPARLKSDALTFPITTGRIDGTSLGGSFAHTGGLRISSDVASVVLQNLSANTISRQVTAEIGTGRLPVFDLDQRQLSGRAPARRLNASGLVALLSPGAAHQLNAALKVSIFTPKLIIGDVSVDASTG